MILILLFLSFFVTESDTAFYKSKEKEIFKGAVSMTVDGKGFIYVLDSETNEIFKLDKKFEIIKRNGKKGWDNGEFDNPTFIDCSNGLDLFVCDGRNFRIQKFDLNLGYVMSINTNSENFPDVYRFQSPIASTFINPNLFVVDGENKRIVVFNSYYVPYISFGGFQSAENPLLNPVKILKDNYNNFYVLDNKTERITKYDNFGNVIKNIEIKGILSASVYNNFIYFLTNKYVFIYRTKTNSFEKKIRIDYNGNRFSDFLIYSQNEFLILEKNKIIEYKLN